MYWCGFVDGEQREATNRSGSEAMKRGREEFVRTYILELKHPLFYQPIAKLVSPGLFFCQIRDKSNYEVYGQFLRPSSDETSFDDFLFESQEVLKLTVKYNKTETSLPSEIKMEFPLDVQGREPGCENPFSSKTKQELCMLALNTFLRVEEAVKVSQMFLFNQVFVNINRYNPKLVFNDHGKLELWTFDGKVHRPTLRLLEWMDRTLDF